MSSNGRATGIFRFGVFELSRATGALLRNGIPVKLPPQPAQVLLLLVERAGDVVTREEIQQLTWSDNTVVDFEVGINRCIRRIRSALLDDADAPRYLETVPRIGYRFIAPVEAPNAEPAPLEDLAAMAPPDLPPLPVKRVRDWKPLALGLIGVCVVAAISIFWIAINREKQPNDLHTAPLAVSFGDQYTPTFSPDGRQVAFTWNGEAQDNFDIYVKLVNSSSPALRLTTSKDVDYSPAWSPDGEWIAFCRGRDTGRGGVWIVPALGGAERKITDMDTPGSPWDRALSWTPDSKRLVVAAPVGAEQHLGLRLIDVNTGASQLIVRPTGSEEDMHPAVSPNGKFIAFTRDTGRGISRIMIVPVGGGTPQPIAAPADQVYNARPAWTPDGSHIVFVSNVDGESHAWLAPFRSSRPVKELAALGDDIHDVAISTAGQLGVVRQARDSNLYMLRLGSTPESVIGEPTRILGSTRLEESPSIRSDGRQLAFASNRSGYEEIWTARADGSDVMQVTYLQNPVTGSPDWSPDGRHIVFDSRAGGRPQLYITSGDGGRAQPICCESGLATVPHWSPDGRSIYFSSDRTGRMEVWSVGATGGTPVQVTKNGGFAPVPSPDGKWLYYSSDNAPVTTLWKQNLVSGEQNRIASSVLRRSYAPADNGLYFFSGSTSRQGSTLFWLVESSQRSQPILTTDRRVEQGVALAPDGRSLFYTQFDVSDHQLLLVQNFWK
ncbi:MAG TPA: winged helix-turn-helix domain-containing protein [Bryobacteraceae bacterium]|nr:winged helix-turn-helix domain-containing protein [Bryobacteraceae bacterium]